MIWLLVLGILALGLGLAYLGSPTRIVIRTPPPDPEWQQRQRLSKLAGVWERERIEKDHQ